MEEERRLAYVAITRAKKRLYLSTADRRMLFGSTMCNSCSRFLNEIDYSLIDKKSARRASNTSSRQKLADPTHSISLQEQLAKEKKASTSGAKQFSSGDRVRHNIFGEGTVLNVTKMANDFLLEVAFDRVGTKKLMSNYAKIQKI